MKQQAKNQQSTEITDTLAKLRSPQIEEAVLGVLLQFSTEETSVLLSSIPEGAFTDPRTFELFGILKSMHREGKKIDIVTVYETAKAKELSLDFIYITELSGRVVTSSHLSEHTAILLDYYKRREALKRVYSSIAGAGDLTTPIEETLANEREAIELAESFSRSKYEQLLYTPTAQELKEQFQQEKQGIPTNYIFEDGSENLERLTLPAGAITIIGAPTSHGKSTILQNLAFNALEATKAENGVILYFTYEEKRQRVYEQFLNKYINEPLSMNNRKSIRYYLSTGKDTMIRGEKRNTFYDGLTAFESELIDTRRLRLYSSELDALELIEFIKYASKKVNVRAVFIDYIQKLKIKGFKGDKRLMYGEISDKLNSLANNIDFPLVLAAQLNREATSPANMYAQQIAEAADIERVANTVLLIWNSRFETRGKSSGEEANYLKKLADREFYIGKSFSGKIYAKLEKNREGSPNIDAIFSFDGNTGTISQDGELLKRMEEKEREERKAQEQVLPLTPF